MASTAASSSSSSRAPPLAVALPHQPQARPRCGPTPNAATPPLLALTPELCDILRHQLAPSTHNDPSLAHQLCLYHRHHDALSARLRLRLPAATPPPPPPPSKSMSKEDGSIVAASSSSSKKRARAGEMVRVTNLGLADHLHFRSLVRRARLTFEALRGIYHRQDDSAGVRNRVDLRASSKMLSEGLWLHRDLRIVGAIPGVLVDDAFYYRAELCVVGLHTAPQAGIGYIPARLVDEGHPIATNIVSSGGYLDDEDSGDVLVYTGSDGRQLWVLLRPRTPRTSSRRTKIEGKVG